MQSMVGYILGLGDRHPSNLMLDRLSGTIMHVDFGDCFEVAMERFVALWYHSYGPHVAAVPSSPRRFRSA